MVVKIQLPLMIMCGMTMLCICTYIIYTDEDIL